jgi:ABC-type spermidine/putrescine transport system permease subunit I
MCFVAVVVQSRLVTFDRSLEEAAMDLGCPPLKTFFVITLPLILPAVIAGWMLAFTLSLDDLVIASFTTGPGATTLPMKIYSQVRLGVTPEINAICTVLIAVTRSLRDQRTSSAGASPLRGSICTATCVVGMAISGMATNFSCNSLGSAGRCRIR